MYVVFFTFKMIFNYIYLYLNIFNKAWKYDDCITIMILRTTTIENILDYIKKKKKKLPKDKNMIIF